MCLLIFQAPSHGKYAFILAGNRDEMLNRPTLPLHPWPGRRILAGQDQLAGGTWLGVAADAAKATCRISALTNVPDQDDTMVNSIVNVRSRGELVMEFLDVGNEGISPEAYARRVQSADYPGFNLLVCQVGVNDVDMCWTGNRDVNEDAVVGVEKLEPDVTYAMTNTWFHGHEDEVAETSHILHWPKVVHSRQEFDDVVKEFGNQDAETLAKELLVLLADGEAEMEPLLVDPHFVPKSGRDFSHVIRVPPVPLESGNMYGTRTSAVILFERDSQTLHFFERDVIDVNGLSRSHDHASVEHDRVFSLSMQSR